VEGLGQNIVDGDTSPSVTDGTDFGTAVKNGPPVSRTFTVRNTGRRCLSGDADGAGRITVTEALDSSIATAERHVHGTDEHVGGGDIRGDISFTNNDGDGGDG